MEVEFEHLTRRAKTKAKVRDDVVKGPSRRGERHLRNLWNGSWGKALDGRPNSNASRRCEKRRLALKPAWRSLIEPEPEKVPQKVDYKPTRVENRGLCSRRKMRGAGQPSSSSGASSEKAKISDEVYGARPAKPRNN